MPMLGVNGPNIVTARALTPADDGRYYYMVSAMQGGATIQFEGTITITPTPPVPVSGSVAPASIQDNAPVGTQVATPTITMSDGSPFTGTLGVTGPA